MLSPAITLALLHYLSPKYCNILRMVFLPPRTFLLKYTCLTINKYIFFLWHSSYSKILNNSSWSTDKLSSPWLSSLAHFLLLLLPTWKLASVKLVFSLFCEPFLPSFFFSYCQSAFTFSLSNLNHLSQNQFSSFSLKNIFLDQQRPEQTLH